MKAWLRPGLLAVCLAGSLGLGPAHGQAPASAAAGEALYTGRMPMTGKLRGHEVALPAQVVVCSNCHEAGPSVGRSSAAYAPPLDAQLAQRLSRRQGPPAAYNAEVLCKVLRTGVDPALIVLSQAMPLFEISDKDCASLWHYFLQRPPGGKAPP